MLQTFSTTSSHTPVRTADLLARICVRPPYFALQDVSSEPDVLWATVVAEQPTDDEGGPMSAGELSRHAAIAGLSVAAMAQADEQRRYYLAQRATYQGLPSDVPRGTPVILQAELLSLSKREARSRITASAAGQVVAVLDVLYTILTEGAFERLFRSHAQPRTSSAPARRMPGLPKGKTVRQGATWSRTVGAVPPEACAGHFDGFPALPVAVLMGQLAQLAGEALGEPYMVAAGEVDAQDFCWAGETARFQVEPLDVSGSPALFDCCAYASERLIGRMRLTLYNAR